MRDRHKKVIGVTGAGAGAGATFIAMCLAFEMGQMTDGVTFAEGSVYDEKYENHENHERVFDILRSDRKFPSRRMVDFYDIWEGGGDIGSRVNLYRNVNWAVRTRSEARACAAEGHSTEPFDFRALAGRYIVVDSPANPEIADIIVCVIDPLPSRLMAGAAIYAQLKEQKTRPAVWLLNKNNPAVYMGEVEHFLQQKIDFAASLVPAEKFYEAQYNCRFICEYCCPEGIHNLAIHLLE